MDYKCDQWKMYSLGIMTLTRTPCELDKMSLFQDLKLKRRKVDSRCSSDGESVADTSTSSPDLLSPSSPKMTDAVLNPPSPDSTPLQLHHPEPTLEKVPNRLEESGVFDGGGGGTPSVIKSLPVIRSHSPPVRPQPQFSPSQPPRPHSSPGRPANISPRTSPVIRHAPLFPPTVASAQEPTSSVSSRSVIISQQQPTQNPQLWLKHSRINGVKPELIGGTFGVKTELIGGNFNVKPELIGGNYVGAPVDVKPPGSPMSRSGPVRQTPTVIMGEAGGVRTMIWSQPSSPANDPQLHPTTSNWPQVSNTDESAAQLLLNLGQDRLRPASRNVVSSPSPTSQFAGGSPLNMERLWAGDVRQLPIGQQTQALNLTAPPPGVVPSMYGQSDVKPCPNVEAAPGEHAEQQQQEEEEQPMICMICEDKATGLHYGIITCEGCKGFFKRTVQNRRVYTCVADGNCEITKAQRNRCQYCRFKKCIEQGMVLQAVREDRMPGGRNSGAVYNLYKVKYKKHKKPSAKQQTKPIDKNLLGHQFKTEPPPGIPSNLVNGTILKTALTNPSEVIRLRQRLDSAVSSSRDRNFSVEYSLSMIKTLIDCDEFQDIATLQNLDELLDHNTDLSEKLCNIGDSIVYKLVQWTKRLPFYLELPVEVHTRLLTHKWHELLVLTTSAYQAIHKVATEQMTTTFIEPDFSQEVESNLCTLQNCLISMMGREITIEQLRQDVGLMIERITHVTLMFRQIKLTMEEYVCLKVITMLNQAKPASSSGPSELETIHERYMTCLRVYTQHMYPQQTTRFQDLLVRLPEIQSAASLLLESKMFYVPFLLNSAIQR
ncbi:hormone receptor 4 isoform X3 [Diorhabda carinulata]|uniref:hormone receptor 4 isoform X3 n=1 Tax=Diorhabda carinulata TaxID=1163345 RepID=UPI0025A0C809|nr:hormone receptor 4 isoform X3 [Diorhabda carinulata]